MQLFVVCLLGLVALSMATPPTLYPRGCIWVMGKCQRECEEGTHGYSTGCGHKLPEATCDVPNPVKEEATICDYTACYCDPPTLRDPKSGKCVKKEDCPKKE